MAMDALLVDEPPLTASIRDLHELQLPIPHPIRLCVPK
jgi:hypothetical protein